MGETVDEEVDYVKATKVLEGMTVANREKYVSEVLTMISGVVEQVMKTQGKIKQMKAWERFNEEMKEKGESGISKGEEIMVCGLYAVKKRFRPKFVELLRVITGIEETVKTE